MNPVQAIDNFLSTAKAIMPEIEEFDAFVADRTAALAELSTLRSALTIAKQDLDNARFELGEARKALQIIKDETAWATSDRGKVRQELDELARMARKRT